MYISYNDLIYVKQVFHTPTIANVGSPVGLLVGWAVGLLVGNTNPWAVGPREGKSVGVPVL